MNLHINCKIFSAWFWMPKKNDPVKKINQFKRLIKNPEKQIFDDSLFLNKTEEDSGQGHSPINRQSYFTNHIIDSVTSSFQLWFFRKIKFKGSVSLAQKFTHFVIRFVRFWESVLISCLSEFWHRRKCIFDPFETGLRTVKNFRYINSA